MQMKYRRIQLANKGIESAAIEIDGAAPLPAGLWKP
jgi:hypothetical protein